jgi:hypothetical protein
MLRPHTALDGTRVMLPRSPVLTQAGSFEVPERSTVTPPSAKA